MCIEHFNNEGLEKYLSFFDKCLFIQIVKHIIFSFLCLSSCILFGIVQWCNKSNWNKLYIFGLESY